MTAPSQNSLEGQKASPLSGTEYGMALNHDSTVKHFGSMDTHHKRQKARPEAGYAEAVSGSREAPGGSGNLLTMCSKAHLICVTDHRVDQRNPHSYLDLLMNTSAL